MPPSDEPSDFELLAAFIAAPVQQFGLAIASSDRTDTLDAVRQALRDVAERNHVRVTSVEFEDDRPLLSQLVETSRDAEVVFIAGLERFLLDRYGGPAFSPAVEQLNWDRDRLAVDVRARVVLWLSDPAARAFAAAARDLDDVVLARYHFPSGTKAVNLDLSRGTIAAVASRLGTTRDELRRSVLDQMLVDRDPGTSAWADVALSRADIAGHAGDFVQAETLFLSAARLYEAAGDLRSAAEAWVRLAATQRATGQLEQALETVERGALPAAQAVGDPRMLAIAYRILAALHEAAGETNKSDAIVRGKLIPTALLVEDPRIRALAFRDLAQHEAVRGERSKAIQILKNNVLPTFRERGDSDDLLLSLRLLAATLVEHNELDEALVVLRQELLPLARRLDDALEQAIALAQIAEVMAAQGNRAHAIDIFRKEVRPLAQAANAPEMVAAIDAAIERIQQTSHDTTHQT